MTRGEKRELLLEFLLWLQQTQMAEVCVPDRAASVWVRDHLPMEERVDEFLAFDEEAGHG